MFTKGLFRIGIRSTVLTTAFELLLDELGDNSLLGEFQLKNFLNSDHEMKDSTQLRTLLKNYLVLI